MYKNGDPVLKLQYLMTETNPWPPMNNVDPTSIVKAPCCQGDITVFGANAGQKCVAMSLCALIYNNIKRINRCNDLEA